MDDLFGAVKSRAESLLQDLNRPGGLRSTIQGIRHKMAEADQRRAINRARAELARLDGQLTETITAVGVQAVALHSAGRLASPELAPLCQHVVDIRTALAEQKDELAKLEALLAARRESQAQACAACGRPLPAEGTFCPHCGAVLPERSEALHCAHCGSVLRPGSRFCPKCGQAVPA